MNRAVRQGRRGCPRRREAAGFTLLELIIVIAVFAVMAALAYGGLSAVLTTRTHVESVMARTSQYQKVYLRMRQDFQSAANRTARDTDGTPLPALFYDSYAHRLEFTRGGWTNPLELPRTGMERVSYRFDDRKLLRLNWRVLDRAPQSEPVPLTLLDGVDEVAWRFLDDKLQPHDGWPPQTDSATEAAAQPPPSAVELTLRTQDWGTLRFLFKLGFDPGAAAAANGGGNPSPNPPPATREGPSGATGTGSDGTGGSG
jgi:general secretion pathway protein J